MRILQTDNNLNFGNRFRRSPTRVQSGRAGIPLQERLTAAMWWQNATPTLAGSRIYVDEQQSLSCFDINTLTWTQLEIEEDQGVHRAARPTSATTAIIGDKIYTLVSSNLKDNTDDRILVLDLPMRTKAWKKSKMRTTHA